MRRKYDRWIDTLNAERTLMCSADVNDFLKRIRILNPIGKGLAIEFYWGALRIGWRVRDTDPGPSHGKPIYVSMGWPIRLPASEQEVAFAAVDMVRQGYEHEFEESFTFDDKRVLDPHNTGVTS